MQVRIKATKMDLTPAIEQYVNEKVEMLNKYLGDVPAPNCDVEVEKLTGHRHGKIFRAEINLSVPGQLLRIEKTEEDLYKAIDKAKDHLVRSIIDYKEKRRA